MTQLNKDAAASISCPKKSLNGRSIKLICTGHADDEHVMNVISEPRIHDSQVLGYAQFWYFFGAMALSWIGMSVVVSVSDAICFELLGKHHELYGNQRLWGAVGFGAFSIISGLLIDGSSEMESHKNYTVIFYLMAVALVPNMIISSCLEVSAFSVAYPIVVAVDNEHFVSSSDQPLCRQTLSRMLENCSNHCVSSSFSSGAS